MDHGTLFFSFGCANGSMRWLAARLPENDRRHLAVQVLARSERLAEAPFVAGKHFLAADITGFVTVDFASGAFDMPISTETHALKRWYDVVAARPSACIGDW
jgi:glutathione S-transferase